LPDFEAIRVVLEEHSVDAKQAEEWARRLASMGANMADAVAVAEQLREGKKPVLEEYWSRGYFRPYPRVLMPDEMVRWIEERWPRQIFDSKHVRLYTLDTPEIAIPIIVSFLACIGKGAVVVVDERYIDEAIVTASSASIPLLVPSTVRDETAKLVYAKTRAPVIFIGMQAGMAKPFIRVSDLIHKAKWRRTVLEIVASFYGAEIEESLLNKAEYQSENRIMDLLETIPTFFADRKITESDVARLVWR